MVYAEGGIPRRSVTGVTEIEKPASANAEPVLKTELEEAAAKDADSLKAEPDVAAVANAESGEAVTATAEAEPADAKLEEAETVGAGLSAPRMMSLPWQW